MKIKSFFFLFLTILINILSASENPVTYEAENLILERPEEKVGYFMGCSLACALGWDFKASSHLESQGENIYTTDVIWDGKFDTAWCEGAEDYGIGEWIEFHLRNYPGRDVKDINFSGVRIANGYQKSEEIWKNNSRVKQFCMDINGETVCYINLNDSMYVQEMIFPEPYFVSAGDIIRFTITDVYPGDVYSDTCISEIVITGAH